MAYYSGINGAMYAVEISPSGDINEQKFAAVRNWSFSSAIQTLDTTSLSQTDRTFVPGMRNTTGSCTVMYYSEVGVTPTIGSAQYLIDSLVMPRTTGNIDPGDPEVPGVAERPQRIGLKLFLDDGSVAGKYINMRVNITSASMMMAQGEIFSVACTFESNGAPLEVTL